jgi:hypothetical protein
MMRRALGDTIEAPAAGGKAPAPVPVPPKKTP